MSKLSIADIGGASAVVFEDPYQRMSLRWSRILCRRLGSPSWATASCKRRPRARKYRTGDFAAFSARPRPCVRVYGRSSEQEVPRGGMPVHVLWALLFLKLYNIKHVHSALVGADEKTCRKWCWVFVKILSGLQICTYLHAAVRWRICCLYLNVVNTVWCRLTGSGVVKKSRCTGAVFLWMVRILGSRSPTRSIRTTTLLSLRPRDSDTR